MTRRLLRSSARLSFAMGLSVVSLALAGDVRAQSRIVIDDFRGPTAGLVRAEAVRSLRRTDDVAVVARSDVDAAARRLGLRRLSRPRDFQRVGGALHVDAFVEGRVHRGRTWRAVVRVRDGSTGRVVSETTYFGRGRRGLVASVRRSFERDLRMALESTSARPSRDEASGSMSFTEAEAMGTPAPASVAARDDEAPPPITPRRATAEEELEALRRENLDDELFARDDERAAGAGSAGAPFSPAHSPLEVEAGLRFLNRGLGYRDDLSARTLPYELPFGSALYLGAAWYSGAHVTNDAFADVGLTARASHSLFLSTAGPNGASYPTAESQIEIGARLRIPVDGSEVGLSLAYGEHAFSVSPGDGREAVEEIASVAYGHARLGADAVIDLGDVSLRASASWLAVTGVGDLGGDAWFPGASAQGFGASLGAGYAIGEGLEARVELDGRFYFLDFAADAGDPFAVGGAFDRYLAIHAGVAWRMPPIAF